ncbi:MAG TPA: alkanesulfonate monooxygenase, partial [Pantoea sp.]|nr:alkanesulfonate monooxygenase [Pantoea sp.]
LVGAPETVAEAALEYYKLGVTTFLFRGFDQLRDAADYGRLLLPTIRERVAAYDTAQASAA